MSRPKIRTLVAYALAHDMSVAKAYAPRHIYNSQTSSGRIRFQIAAVELIESLEKAGIRLERKMP